MPLLFPLLLVIAVLLVWPVCVLAYGSVHGQSSFTLDAYRQLVSDPFYRDALIHSLILSFAVAAAATLLCLGPAWLFARHEFRGKRMMRTLFTLPMSLSGIMVGFLAVVMLGRVGFVPQVLAKLTGTAFLSGASYQLTGLVIAYLYFEIPRGILTLESSLRKFDPRFDAAARSLGANRSQRFLWVVLPLIRPALVSTFALTFSVSLGSFGVALILSRRFSVLPLELFHEFTAMFNLPLASAMAIVLVTVALALNALANRQWKKDAG